MKVLSLKVILLLLLLLKDRLLPYCHFPNKSNEYVKNGLCTVQVSLLFKNGKLVYS